jgi:tetratricopeptide (TPR) repeat protein
MITDRQRLDLLLSEGNYLQAEQIALAILETSKQDATLWFALARICYYTNRLDEALEHCRTATSFQPHWVDPVYLAGLIYKATGHPDKAVNAWEYVLSLNSQHLYANLQLASLFAETGRHIRAVHFYQNALKLAPDNTIVLCNLGHLLHELGNYEEAIQLYQRAIALQPGYEILYINLAYAYQAMEKYSDALQWYRKARRVNPQLAAAAAGEANILHRTGDTTAALELVERFLPENKKNIPLVTLYLSLSKSKGDEENAISLAESALNTPGASRNETVQLLFALATAHDVRGNYDEAFRYFEQANSGKFSRYDPEQQSKKVRKVISFFSPDMYASLQRSSLDTDIPVFILGMPRSGTSLVEQILATHPKVFAAGETQYLHRLAIECGKNANVPQSDYPECLEALPRHDLTNYSLQYLEYLQNLSPCAERITDKTPHNFLHIPLITLLFPNARIIHCRRHPLDTCLSCYFRYFSGGNEYSYDLEHLAQHYADYLALMEHWRKLGIPMLEICYESLVNDQEYWSRKIIEYCGLDWDQKCLEFYKTGREIPSASFDQVTQPIYRGSVYRWKNYAARLDQLRNKLGSHITQYEKEILGG